jgi:hypothetical protein
MDFAWFRVPGKSRFIIGRRSSGQKGDAVAFIGGDKGPRQVGKTTLLTKMAKKDRKPISAGI